MVKRNRFYVSPLLLIVFLVLIILFVSNHKENPLSIPKCPNCNVILIVMDNVRAESLGFEGYGRKTSPNINKFAEDAIVFTNTFSQISWSLPAAASLFTSKYPFAHGLLRRRILDANESTLAEVLKSQGYNTVAYTGGGDWRSIYGLNQGFDIFDDNDKSAIFTGSFNRTIPLAIQFLEKNRNKKFFLFVHGYDAHCPFNPSTEFLKYFEHNYNGTINESLCVYGGYQQNKTGKYMSYYAKNATVDPEYSVMVPVNISKEDITHMINLYDGEIRHIDYLIGDLFYKINKLGIAKNTIVILTADHGESLGKHENIVRVGYVRGNMQNEILHVPLIIKHPYFKKPKRITGLAQSIDIMPTILDFLNITIPYQAQGLSLVPLIESKKDKIHEYVFAGGNFSGYFAFPFPTINSAIISDRWKLIYERSPSKNFMTLELYDLINDPQELNDLSAEEPELTRELKKKLLEWENKTRSGIILKQVTLTKEELKQAQDAGYLG